MKGSWRGAPSTRGPYISPISPLYLPISPYISLGEVRLPREARRVRHGEDREHERQQRQRLAREEDLVRVRVRLGLGLGLGLGYDKALSEQAPARSCRSAAPR